MIGYHYCRFDVCNKILKEQTLRLCDIYKMNDYKEIAWQKELLLEVLENYTINESAKEYILKTYDLNAKHIFISSLSKKRDLLSQWRSYGDDGQGIAIGFNLTELNIKFTPPVFHIVKPEEKIGILECNYDFDEQKKFISDYIDYYLDPDYRLSNGEKISKQSALLLACIDIKHFASQFKHPSFSEEKEIRIAYLAPDRGTVKYKKNVLGNIEIQSLCKYDNREYFPMRFIKKHSVSEIIIGPKCEKNIKDVKNYCEFLGYSNLNIFKSEIPYR